MGSDRGLITGYSEKLFPRIAVPVASVREADYRDNRLSSLRDGIFRRTGVR
jgi:hypothetical protein